MCGIAGYIAKRPIGSGEGLDLLNRMNEIQRHRGPDGNGVWQEPSQGIGLAHTRLSIIDLGGNIQPMKSDSGHVIAYNGEIYNYLELRQELGEELFQTTSDTEVILRAYEKWGDRCVEKFRGMFAFALWDVHQKRLFVARDRFGIKPFYYIIENSMLYFASEIKTLIPFMNEVKTNLEGLRDYFTFQFFLGGKTLFQGVHQIQPAHCGYIDGKLNVKLRRYWEVHFDIDWNHTEKYFVDQVREKVFNSVALHLRSDVEVGAYISGGMDSSLVASLAREMRGESRFQGFHGKFSMHQGFDESRYARILAEEKNMLLHETDITDQDFIDHIAKVIYHLDHPIAGPGSFPQYMVSKSVKDRIKVVIGGQGGDEIFGGYTRYLIAYFEQCIKGAIDGMMSSGNFVVTYESIIPNLASLENYKPLLQEFWAKGIFDSRDRRYYRLINRSNTFGNIIEWSILNGESSFDDFQKIYWGENVGKEAYFDSMTHFDFKTLLPALLHVEDRMSMAHSIESRVPFLDHEVVELAASVPADIKFKNGELKRLLRVSFGEKLPVAILGRKDKMGFPVPLHIWMKGKSNVSQFVLDTFRSRRAQERFYLAKGLDIEKMMQSESPFSRNLWALLGLELWQQQFHDQHASYRGKRP